MPYKRVFQMGALFLIRAYQYVLSPVLGPACRFYPTCSDYAYQAILRYGIFSGSHLMIRRILRCHPFNPGGFDPVPQEKTVVEYPQPAHPHFTCCKKLKF